MRSLTDVISRGLRPLGVKASLQTWLGTTVGLQEHAFWREWGGLGSFTGKSVSVDQALKLSTVWACVRLIAGTLATLPLGFYRRRDNGSRDSATSHDLYEILHNQPNAEQTAVVFWEMVVASLLLWGNAFIEIDRRGRVVTGLRCLHPARTTAKKLKDGGYEFYYRDTATSKERLIPGDRMMHIPAFSTDGMFGLSPIAYGVNVFTTSIETDRVSAETFANSLKSPGIITMDVVFSREQREEVRKHVKRVSDDGGVMVLEKGSSFSKLGIDPVSAELLASRSWNVEEMCRWYSVDPSMIGHGGKDSNWGTGLEQKMQWFITFTLRNWCVKIEQAIRKSLLTPIERQRYFAEFALEGLLRGDSSARASYLSTMWQNGGMTRNEGRAKENLPPLPGGDVLTVQSNLIKLSDLGKNKQEPSLDAIAAMLSK